MTLKILFSFFFLLQSTRVVDWNLQSWGKQPPKIKALVGKSMPFYFDIPHGDGNGSAGIGYMTVRFTEDITNKTHLVFTFQTNSDGAPVYNVNLQADNQAYNCYPPPIGDGYPAIIVPILVRNGAYNSGLVYPDPGQYYRWFARDYKATLIPNGLTQVDVPMDPAVWMSVYGIFGDAATQEFADTLADLDSVGFTFGGGCYLSHGINIESGTGNTRFTLINYSFQ